MDLDLERQIISRFAHPDKVQRFLYKVSRQGHRPHILAELYNPDNLNPLCLHEVSDKLKFPEMLSVLHRHGFKRSCYVMSIAAEIDGRTVPLIEALERCLDSGIATILYCPQNHVGYYEADQSGRYLLKASYK